MSSPVRYLRVRAVPRWLRAHRRGLLLTVGIALVLLTAATMRLFVWPATDRVEDPDAMVLFVGGWGERLEKAVELARHHTVEALVIPNGTDPTWPAANTLCNEPQQFLVYCPTPQPDTTRGEARAVAELATQEGWDRLAMVTSDYHVSRTRLLLSRCFDGDLAVVRADSRLGPLNRAIRIAHEWVGLGRAHIIDRSC